MVKNIFVSFALLELIIDNQRDAAIILPPAITFTTILHEFSTETEILFFEPRGLNAFAERSKIYLNYARNQETSYQQ